MHDALTAAPVQGADSLAVTAPRRRPAKTLPRSHRRPVRRTASCTVPREQDAHSSLRALRQRLAVEPSQIRVKPITSGDRLTAPWAGRGTLSSSVRARPSPKLSPAPTPYLLLPHDPCASSSRSSPRHTHSSDAARMREKFAARSRPASPLATAHRRTYATDDRPTPHRTAPSPGTRPSPVPAGRSPEKHEDPRNGRARAPHESIAPVAPVSHAVPRAASAFLLPLLPACLLQCRHIDCLVGATSQQVAAGGAAAVSAASPALAPARTRTLASAAAGSRLAAARCPDRSGCRACMRARLRRAGAGAGAAPRSRIPTRLPCLPASLWPVGCGNPSSSRKNMVATASIRGTRGGVRGHAQPRRSSASASAIARDAQCTNVPRCQTPRVCVPARCCS